MSRLSMQKSTKQAVALIVSFVFAVSAAFSIPFTSYAKESTEAEQCFDAGFYAAANPDVVNAVGTGRAALFKHYMDFGRLEGRAASAEFNLLAYKAANPDLAAAFGGNWDAYAKHYRQSGKAEGRIGTGNPSIPIVPVISGLTARPLIYEMEGIAKGRTDIGNTYVEIDLTLQHLWLFVNGVATMETDIVTGSEAGGHSTPPGIFQITYKTTDVVLKGPDYRAPVSYWMPFNGGIGMHDATWRGSFGKQIYKTNGSHGCINMPKSKAKTLYESAYKAMPVICHY